MGFFAQMFGSGAGAGAGAAGAGAAKAATAGKAATGFSQNFMNGLSGKEVAEPSWGSILGQAAARPGEGGFSQLQTPQLPQMPMDQGMSPNAIMGMAMQSQKVQRKPIQIMVQNRGHNRGLLQ